MLNFTRGTYVKSLCSRAYDLVQQSPQHAREEILPIVDRHLARISRNSGGYWGMTKSDWLYSEKLKLVKSFLEKGTADDLLALAESIAAETWDKVKIVFLAQEPYCWASFDSLYRTMLKDPRFDPQIVYVPMAHVNQSKMDFLAVYRNEMGLPVLYFDEYALADESPDIAMFMKAYDNIPPQFYIENIRKAVPRSMYIQYGLEVGTEYIDYHFRLPLGYHAWRHIAYGRLLKENAAKYGYRNGSNVYVWGNPRADYYGNLDAERKNISTEWTRRINGRFCFLWTPHHTVDTSCGSFLDYKDTVISYFENTKEVFLIWRPHPMLLSNLLTSGVMMEDERDSLVSRVSGMDNVILDTTPDYRQSFFASDAIVADASTFVFEYLYTGRPVIYTKKLENAIYNSERFERGVYVIAKADDVALTLGLVAGGEDPLKNERSALKKDLLFTPESGTVGQYIADNCYADLIREMTALEENTNV